MDKDTAQLATEALSLIPRCSICHYPISKIVKALIKGGRRPAPGPYSFTCECGITDSERERFGPPENVIAKMIMENETDWYRISEPQSPARLLTGSNDD